MLLTKLNHPCPECHAAAGESCVRGKKRKPQTVFCQKRPADWSEVMASAKRAPIAMPA